PMAERPDGRTARTLECSNARTRRRKAALVSPARQGKPRSSSRTTTAQPRRTSVNLLLAEVAQATQRLADAGVPSPRNDAEELAAFVHGVKRGELHRVPDADFDA